MTVEEAVKTLKANYGSYSETLKKIVDNAIEAVRKDGKNMTREEAIGEINKVFEPAFANYIIIALGQPEIIRCEDCHYYDGGHCDMYNAGTYPTDYCSYAGWKYEEDES